MAHQENDTIALPAPGLTTKPSIERLLQQRRSVREYQSDAAITLPELGQLLWAAQGITHGRGLRTAPSAGALYPLQLYVVAGNVDALPTGVYRYMPKRHQLYKVQGGDQRRHLARAALSQSWIGQAAAVVVFTAVYARTTGKYGQRGERYVHIEVGHAAQNLFLQAEALTLSTVVVGAFDDAAVAMLLPLPEDIQPLVLMPVGKP